MNVLEPPVLVFNRYLIEIQKQGSQKRLEQTPQFLEVDPGLLRLCVFGYDKPVVQPISYAILPIDSFLTRAIFFSVMNPSFSLGNRLYRQYLVIHSRIRPQELEPLVGLGE
jgi:hypothetical protein